jgi:hypothetical protein
MICKACGREDKFDFHVPDVIWKRVAPARFANRVLCLGCFDEFACQAGVEYAGYLGALFCRAPSDF